MSSIVTIVHFDRGIITTMGAVLVPVHEDGGARQHYAIDFAGVRGPDRFGGKVPVFFVVGNGPYTPKFYPCVVVRRESISPAFDNGGAWFHIDYRKRAKNTQDVTVNLGGQEVTGSRHLEMKERAIPYRIGYEVSAHSRGDRAMSDTSTMMLHLSRIFVPPGFGMRLLDSEGLERGYDVMVESLSPNLSALDLTDRDAGLAWSLMVHGELDHTLPFDAVSVYNAPSVSLEPKTG